MLKYLLAAVALLMAPVVSPAAAQTAESGAQIRAQREFALWLQNVSRLLERASVANDVFLRFAQNSSVNEEREQMVARLLPLRPEAESAQLTLANIQVELGTIAPFQSEHLPDDYALMSETILRDSGTYLRNVDAILGLTIELIDAFERNDEAALRRLAPRLMQGASLLIDGQIVTVRTRQLLMPPDSSDYYSLAVMLALYEGMRACAIPNIASRANTLDNATAAAVAAGQQGRAALAREAQGIGSVASRETDIMRQMIASKTRFFNVNDRVVPLLQAAAQEARAGAGPDTLNARYVPALAALEIEFISLNQEQVALFGQLTEAGHDL